MSHHHESVEIGRRKQTFYSKADQAKFKIILVGDSAVGKTSLFLAFTDQAEEQEKPKASVTAVDFRLKPIQIDGEMVKLHIWDTAGQQRYRSLVQSFFKGCQGAIIVFDLSRKQSFTHATTQWFKMCTAHVKPNQIILVANKSDLQHSISEKQIQQWTSKNGVSYFLTSVTKQQNIDEPFVEIAKIMTKKKKQQVKAQLYSQIKQTQKKPEQKITLKIEPVKSEKKKGCC